MERHSLSARYLGDEKAEVRIGEHAFVVDERVNLHHTGPGLCPVELVAAALAA